MLDIKTLEEDPGAAQEFARSKADARKEGLTGVEFRDIAGLDPILGEVLEVGVREVPDGKFGCALSCFQLPPCSLEPLPDLDTRSQTQLPPPHLTGPNTLL